MKLVGAALVLLAISGCSADVVQDFTKNCSKFFANPDEIATPPTRFNEPQYKQICQTLNDSVEYATYYDTANRIPVYSAYRFEGFKNCSGRQGLWYIEPQLDQEDGDRNMAQKKTVPSKLRGKHQALNEDYKNSSYDRGHLIPLYYAKTRSCATATFTLTNAAPQNHTFNNDEWKKTEQKMGKILSTNCLNVGLSAYVVTGVIPGNEKINNRVNVPSYFWTSYCCLDNNNKPQISGGYYGANINNPVNNVSVSDLEILLTNEYKKGQFQLFGNGSCMAGQGSTEAFNLDRSRTGLFIKKDNDK
ncbi:endonuclease domain-containing 1 protein-like [Trichomycterus rosablanca]|uniref:endonuclease domain-containing 1 protein-like n=1 Tax=Trichomycterus rosablanca TaxID=2290929 RepID=UPI002F356BCC